MSDQNVIGAEMRDRAGKGAARATRRAGRVPAVIYGDKKDPVMISLEPRELRKQLNTGSFFATVYSVEVADGDNERAQRTAITELDKFHFATLALSKDLFKNKATITFNVNDLFNTKKGIYNTLEANTISYIDFRYDTQYLLTFVYRFNKSKIRNVKNRAKDTQKNVFEVDYELN